MRTPERSVKARPDVVALWLKPWRQAPRVVRFAELDFPTHRRQIVIGKSRMCHIVVEGDDFVSGEHCMLEAKGAQLWVSDLGSTNGTAVNDLPLTERRRVEAGHKLQFGDSFAFLLDASERVPIVAASYSSFLVNAAETHGSTRAAGAAVGRGHSTVRRALDKRRG